jgi:hypothetical protein
MQGGVHLASEKNFGEIFSTVEEEEEMQYIISLFVIFLLRTAVGDIISAYFRHLD